MAIDRGVENQIPGEQLSAEEQAIIRAAQRQPSGEPQTPEEAARAVADWDKVPNIEINGVGVNPDEEGNNNTSTETSAGSGSNNDTAGLVSTDSNSDDQSTATRTVTPSTPTNVKQTVVKNPLHNYPSYTYNISLHLLDDVSYEQVMRSPQRDYTAKNVLIAGAGRWGETRFIRNPYFQEDFYFDNLKINSVVNMTPRSRSSNVVDLFFTIIEPNGFTLINRLLAANTTINSKNYLDMPYLLQIDFFGIQDDGTMGLDPIAGQSKYIPISLVSLKSKLTSKGAEYQIQAVPYSHRAFNESVVSTPANFQIKAQTVGDFFGNGELENINAVINARQRLESERKRIEVARLSGEASASDLSKLQQDLDQLATSTLNQVWTLTDGYSNAMNAWLQNLVTQNARTVADKIVINIDPEIKSSILVIPNKNSTAKVANATKDAQSAARSQAGQDVPGPNFTQGYFPINAGSSIERIINDVIRNSSYIRDQITDPKTDGGDPQSTANKLNKPLNWFKIVPEIRLGQYDPSVNQYSKTIIYHVKKWTVNNKHPHGPLGKVPGWVKQYNYMYTGQNDDVLDLNIDFDMLYYIQVTENRSKTQRSTDVKVEDVNTGVVKLNKDNPVVYPQNVVQPQVIKHVSGDQQNAMQFDTQKDGKSQTIANINKDLTGSARGDMINIKLRIIGDPTLIIQDDVWYQNVNSFGAQLTPNGSIVTTDGELYVLVNFENPIDYDENTGMRSDLFRYSMFSGIYSIVTIDNSFSKGKFEQTLDLVRLANQPEYDSLIPGNNLSVIQNYRIENPLTNILTPSQNLSAMVQNGLRLQAPTIFNAGQLVQTGQGLASLAQQVARGGTSLVSGVVSSVVNQTVSAVTSSLTKAATDAVNKATDSIKDIFNSSTALPNGDTYQIFDDGSALETLADGTRFSVDTEGNFEVVGPDTYNFGTDTVDAFTPDFDIGAVDFPEFDIGDLGDLDDFFG